MDKRGLALFVASLLPPSAPVAPGRIAALDGLRGIAAAIVVVFHYLCLLHWSLVPAFNDEPPTLVDTPLSILWNGHFAVAVFFVLSGFVMAKSAERARGLLVSNTIVRYLRLALPVTVSVLLAWGWLSLFPGAVSEMQTTEPAPSPWLRYTYTGPIPDLHLALIDGLAANFIRGGSGFNNVLWTMQIELVGSVVLFAFYWLTERQWRLWLLAAAGLLISLFLRDAYLAFVTGAILYEATKRGVLNQMPAWSGVLALILGVLLGAPGPGFDTRFGISDDLPTALRLGTPVGFWQVLAASLLLYAVLILRPLGQILSKQLPQWLGRISFGLYLVHVPPLYTAVAAVHLTGTMPKLLLALLYFSATLGMAHIFTRMVDEPSLRMLRGVRTRLAVVEERAA